MVAQFESNPAEAGADQSISRIIHMEGVGATQVDSESRGGIDDENSRARPDPCVDRAPIQRQPRPSAGTAEDAQPGIGIDPYLADVLNPNPGARLSVGF